MSQAQPAAPDPGVPTVRVGGGAERRRSYATAVAIVVGTLLIVAVGWIGSRSELPADAGGPTSTPSASSVPIAAAGASAGGPAASFGAGPRPAGLVVVREPSLGFVDVGSGALSSLAPYGPGALVPGPGATGWTCVCVSVVGNGRAPVTHVVLLRLDATGAPFRSPTTPPIPFENVSLDVAGLVDVAVSPSAPLVYVSTSEVTTDGWRLGLEVIDLDSGAVRQEEDVPSAPPTTTATLASPVAAGVPAPAIRIAPDGRSLIGWVDVSGVWPADAGPGGTLTWAAELAADGRIGAIRLLTTDAATAHPCPWTGFLRADLVVTVCPTPTLDDSGRMNGSAIAVRAFRPDGSPVAERTVQGGFLAFYAEPLLDQANALVYLWDPHRDSLVAIALGDGSVSVVPQGAARHPAVQPAEWGRPDSSLATGSDGLLIGVPDGEWLYALGLAPDGPTAPAQGASIWVFDALTQRVADRWPAGPGYASLGVTGDSRWVAAGGSEAPAGALAGPMLAVHDAVSGQVVARFSVLPWDSPPILDAP